MKDYYKILGVSETASIEEIKKAYRKLAHQYHPDRADGNETKFKEINEAYQTLSNQEKRRQYDARRNFGAGGFDFGFGPFGFSGQSSYGWQSLDDLLSEFFGGMAGAGFSGQYQGGFGSRTKTAPKQIVRLSYQGPKGVVLTVELAGVSGLEPKLKQVIDEFSQKIFKEVG
ncbi:MAG: DnaJ domain-containing protein [Patescibacteria group bacterium]